MATHPDVIQEMQYTIGTCLLSPHIFFNFLFILWALLGAPPPDIACIKWITIIQKSLIGLITITLEGWLIRQASVPETGQASTIT
eukprot:scaffold218216_cov18-Tisochrysis_lutea.AAC.1